MTPEIQAYDDAFRIVQNAIVQQDSITGINFLTRIEFYLIEAGRSELKKVLEEK